MAQLGRVRRAGTALVLALSTLVFGACARQTPAPPAVQPTAAPEQTEPLDAFLWGTWYNLEDENCRYEFAPEGTVTVFTGEEERTVPYRFAGETVTVSQDFDLILRVTSEDGVTHLRRDALELNLVSAADYPYRTREELIEEGLILVSGEGEQAHFTAKELAEKIGWVLA